MSSDRDAAIRRLAEETFDVLVIGGGITGAGVALDAASRGLKVALVERRDLASGTSSKSSKLVHGGLRYLQQREFRLVYQALAERQRLRHTAPHLVRLLPFLIPIFGKDGIIHPKLRKALNSALWMYDLTGGARIGKLHDQIDKDATLGHVPTLKADRTLGAFIYYDAQTDDARLTMTIARSAIDHGAVVVNWCPVVEILKDGDRACGARVAVDGGTVDVRAGTVVNAAGVWSDEVRALDEGHDPDSIRPAKGIHVTVPWEKVRNDIACVFPVPKDRRSIFVVPMGGKTYIGTTDTDYDGPIDDPQCTAEDVAYLLGAMNASITPPLTEDDVLGTWAGLRPLVKSAGISERTADLSRHHKVVRSASGVVSVTGGKLTTYRRMAEDTVDEIAKRTRCRTKKLRLHGADGYDELVKDPDGAESRLGISAELVTHLANRHGGETRVLAAMIVADPTLGEPVVHGLPHVKAEAVHAVRHELARTLDDVLTRRIPARWLARDAAAAAAEDVARLIAPELGWSDADVAREVAAFRAAVDHEREAAGLPVTMDA
ncbi:MAG TPA: glycerol-3-phosphate dehydrogenase/oxidase [Acidimicrobiales bacterium]|nr:glycerol-3-phosphate dehydrogenase/oxidase [Acidimicrobiales bacterium]